MELDLESFYLFIHMINFFSSISGEGVVALKHPHLDFTTGCHKTTGDSGPDKIIYNLLEYVCILS